MRNLDELNINEGGLSVSRPSPTPEDYEQFEAKFGIPIPEQVRALLSYSNGGHPELDTYFSEDLTEDSSFAIDRFLFLALDSNEVDSFDYALKLWRPLIGPQALPFALDGGGDPFFLDLTAQPAAVKKYLHDSDKDMVFVAPNFEAFIDGLNLNPDYI